MITEMSHPKVLFDIDRNLFPFKSRFLNLKNGTRIHYVDEGNGPVLLFLHGDPTWSFLYRNIIKNLKSSFRCVALDYPGYGLSSSSPDNGFSPAQNSAVVGEFVEELGLREITIMVQDWGGPIGFDFAINNPELVKGFIIGNTWGWPIERIGQRLFSAIMGGIVGRLVASAFNGVVRLFMFKGVAKPLSNSVLAMYLAPFEQNDRRNPTHIAPKQLVAAKSFLVSIYQNMKVLADKPALIVWGLSDFAFQKPELSRFENLFVNHETVLLEKAGHFLQEDKPDEISNAIRDWYSL